MSEQLAALRELMQKEIEGSQHDGMRLGIKYAAKTLRDTADALEKEPNVFPDYIRGIRDSAVFIEGFAAHIPPNEPQP